ncbi:hypothetical protein DFH46_004373 [Clostridium beijerinckii]|uniref:hypothetical protein n=1 Tax=Clostridium beijerinckii TaxID=1520 RepID=UPI001F4BCE92|nr:hypothetical protein [Clostridium beijerinckii]NRV16822.1 hypothetical protein [Clostridium beijerinckii]
MRKKVELNIRFMGNKVLCAKSPINCKDCVQKSNCEKLELFYYPYTKKKLKNVLKMMRGSGEVGEIIWGGKGLLSQLQIQKGFLIFRII